MKRKSKNKKLTLILVLLLLISVGYAALASNLKINGSSKVNAAKWNVYWDNVQITEGSVPADNDHKARITDTGKTQVEFSIELNEPGDYYEFTVDAVNNGTIDAMIAANGIVNGVYSDSSYTTPATLPDAVSYTVTYADGTAIQEKHLLAKKSGNTATRETYKVRIEYRNDDEIDADDLDENDQTYYFKFSVNYVQADGTAIDKNSSASSIHYVSRQNEEQITPGDIIGIGETEDFYVVSSNQEKTVLIAKYNLLVGYSNNESTNYEDTYISPSTPGYGLQSVDAIGYSGAGSYYSTLAFSSTNYWDDGNGTLLSPYNANGASYDGNPKPFVYNSSLTTAPNFENDGWNTPGYSIAYYVEQYKTKLIEMGAPSTITGRLLSYEEADNAQSIEDNGTSIIFDGRQSYWLGSAGDGLSVWYVRGGDSDFGSTDSSDDRDYGVRPVIEIPTSEIR